jgi:hypothetical protein
VASFLTVPGAIAVVNGVIAGFFAGLLVGAVALGSLAVGAGAGVGMFLVSVFWQRRHQVER